MLSPMECASEIKRELHRCAKICREEYNWAPFPLEVRWDLRGTTAGTAWMDRRVRFNLLLLIEQSVDEVRFVAAHEFAHIAVFKSWALETLTKFKAQLRQEISFDELAFLSDADLSGRGPSHHGPEWRSMMLKFGFPPRRYHWFDTTKHRRR